jgi:hypothetical protein
VDARGPVKLNLSSSLRIVVARRTRTDRRETERYVIRRSMRLVAVRVIVGGVTSRLDSRAAFLIRRRTKSGEGVLLSSAPFVAVATSGRQRWM